MDGLEDRGWLRDDPATVVREGKVDELVVVVAGEETTAEGHLDPTHDMVLDQTS